MIGTVRPVGYQAADFGWFGIELLDQTADASAAAAFSARIAPYPAARNAYLSESCKQPLLRREKVSCRRLYGVSGLAAASIIMLSKHRRSAAVTAPLG